MKEQRRLVFAGPVGSGKTTAIRALSDEPIISTEALISGNNKDADKRHTTVALDFGVIHLDDKTNLQLYGTPGHQHFDFMWDIAARNSIGLLLLLDGRQSNLLEDLTVFTQAFRQLLQAGGFAVGITHADKVQNLELLRGQINHEIERLQLVAPVLSIDPRQRKEVVKLIKALLYTLDPSLIKVS